MDEWFGVIDEGGELSAGALRELREAGFVVVPGPVSSEGLARLVEAYDAAVACASAEDVGVGSTTTRVNDFVNRGPEFDGLYVYAPILEACCRVIGRPFKLSALLARTVRPNVCAQKLHVDFEREADGWPMVGFILMLDGFRADNGATRFVPGSHRWQSTPRDFPQDASEDYDGQTLACGPAGSVIIYNGSVWHGHAANRSGEPRRSIQGTYIRRDAAAAINQAARMRPETFARIGDLAKYLLAV